jgi:hypothetical protein
MGQLTLHSRVHGNEEMWVESRVRRGFNLVILGRTGCAQLTMAVPPNE